MSAISPQGYQYGETPGSVHPFWDDSTYITNLTASAEVSQNVGDPSVNLEVTSEDGVANLHFAFTGIKGETGETGEQGEAGPQGPQGIQGPKGDTGDDGLTPVISADASVDNTSGTPGVSVSRTGTVEEPTFTFSFTGLKGATGETGAQGPKGDTGETGPQGPKGDTGETGPQGSAGATPIISAAATVDDTTGTPSVTVTKTGTDLTPTFTFAFTGLKGSGGSSVIKVPGTQTHTSLATFKSDINEIISGMSDGDSIVVPYLFTTTDTTWPIYYYKSANYYRYTEANGSEPREVVLKDDVGNDLISGVCTLSNKYTSSASQREGYVKSGLISRDMLQTLEKEANNKMWIVLKKSGSVVSATIINNRFDEVVNPPQAYNSSVGDLTTILGEQQKPMGVVAKTFSTRLSSKVDTYVPIYNEKPFLLGVYSYIEMSGNAVSNIRFSSANYMTYNDALATLAGYERVYPGYSYGGSYVGFYVPSDFDLAFYEDSQGGTSKITTSKFRRVQYFSAGNKVLARTAYYKEG